jgi:hypothetical protein
MVFFLATLLDAGSLQSHVANLPSFAPYLNTSERPHLALDVYGTICPLMLGWCRFPEFLVTAFVKQIL